MASISRFSVPRNVPRNGNRPSPALCIHKGSVALTLASVLEEGADAAAVVDVLRVARGEGLGAGGQRVVVHVVQLAVVVGAGGRAEVQERPAQELGLDLARPPARLLAVGLRRGGGGEGKREARWSGDSS